MSVSYDNNHYTTGASFGIAYEVQVSGRPMVSKLCTAAHFTSPFLVLHYFLHNIFLLFIHCILFINHHHHHHHHHHQQQQQQQHRPSFFIQFSDCLKNIFSFDFSFYTSFIIILIITIYFSPYSSFFFSSPISSCYLIRSILFFFLPPLYHILLKIFSLPNSRSTFASTSTLAYSF